ncbi:hypothetical protein BS50DRAFT_593789 [Corynespora cassiicola Philippines]|uniref:Uncharacterized protein n=1 Tax=Corynespora cassiicola Philippines TaxID=1448308 RepID=A0A2T2N4M1_CORCC|nr:hypothetical protein BS50DRAFT_593789 [Corynespora cassiicola Philippines]
MHINVLSILLLATTVTSFPLSLHSLSAYAARHKFSLAARQVGDGVTGNQTASNGSTGGTGIGDDNGVGFAGTGNDIDTGESTSTQFTITHANLRQFQGDDFDIGDGNTTMGDGNHIEVGDRITTINIPLNMSEMIAQGVEQSRSRSGNGGLDMNIDISMRIRIADGNQTLEKSSGNSTVTIVE